MFTPWRNRTFVEKALSIGLLAFVLILSIPVFMYRDFATGLTTIFVVVVGLLVILFGMTVVSQLSVAVHELGHYFAGKAVGFRFISLKVGPLLWWKGDKGLRFSFNRSDQRAYGYVSMVPVNDERIMAKYRTFILGGPVASLLLLLAFAWATSWRSPFEKLPKGATGAEFAAYIFFVLTFLLLLIMAVSSIIPFRYRGFYNDGATFLLPLFNKREAELRVLLMKWGAVAGTGQKCADWDVTTLRRIRDLATAPLEQAIYGQNLANALLYSGDIENGLRIMDESYALLKFNTGLMSEFECGLALDTTFSRAHFGRNLAAARESMAQAERLTTPRKAAFCRARAAIAILEGDRDAAKRHAEEAKDWLAKNCDLEKPIYRVAIEEMDLIISESEELHTKPPLTASASLSWDL